MEGTGRIVGRYAVCSELAAGGMATVHLGKLLGAAGFSRVVALKSLHAQFAKDPAFVAAFLDEAMLASRIRHPNVVSVLDVVHTDGELFLVMDYVAGETLGRLMRAASAREEPIPPSIVGAILSSALHGLHAAHEAKNEAGEPLSIVHRDISPQNILVGSDGVARVLDFGIAKAAGRLADTKIPMLKGKIAYMPQEQARLGEVTRRSDVYAAGVVMWEMLTLQRLFEANDEVALLTKVLSWEIPEPSSVSPNVVPDLEAIALRALRRDPSERFASALEMAAAIEAATPIAPPTAVAAWLEGLAGPALTRRAEQVSVVERARIEATPPRNEDTTAGVEVASERTVAVKVTRRRWGVPAAIASVVLLLVLAIAGVAATRERPEPTAAAPVPRPVASSPSAAPTPSASPSPSPSPEPSASPPPAVSTAVPKVAVPTSKIAAPKKAKCDPPYTVDSLGHHRYLPECF